MYKCAILAFAHTTLPVPTHPPPHTHTTSINNKRNRRSSGGLGVEQNSSSEIFRKNSREYGLEPISADRLRKNSGPFGIEDPGDETPVVHNVMAQTRAARRNMGVYSLAERLKEEKDASEEAGAFEDMRRSSSGSIEIRSRRSSRSASLSAPVKDVVAPAEQAPAPPAVAAASEAPVVEKSRAAKNWGKLRLANKMKVAFKNVNEEVQMFGAKGDDDHIDWKNIYEKEEVKEEKRFLIDPEGSFMICWDVFMTFLLLYTAFHVPYRVCLYWDDGILTQFLKTMEYGSDIFFGIDVILNFFTAYYDEESGLLIEDRKEIAVNYLKTYFFVDFIACLPFGLMFGGSARTLNKAGKVMKLGMLIKVLRPMRLLKLLNFTRLTETISTIENNFSIHQGFSRMLKIIFVVLLVTHMVGCLWYLIGRSGGPDLIDGGWMWRYHMTDHTLEAQYVTSLYWAFSTLTTVGYGDISARTAQEQVYSMLMMLLGVSWYAYIVSSMSTIMASFDRQNKAIKEKMHSVNAFIQDAKLPATTAKLIRRYYDFALTANKNKSLLNSNVYNADMILEELSSGLRAEVLLYVERALVSKIPFLKGKIPQFVADCITMFQPMVFQEGDFIIKEGSAADEMYFLIKGRCAVYYGNKKMVSMTEGSYFGEVGCIMGGIRRAGIKALTLCELQALARRNLNILLAEYPDVGEELKKVAKQRAAQVRSSTVQRKQVDGMRRMLEEREKVLKLQSMSENIESCDNSDATSGADFNGDNGNTSAVVRSDPQGNNNNNSMESAGDIRSYMSRGMSITSGFGSVGSGGGSLEGSQSSESHREERKSAELGELEEQVNMAIENKFKDVRRRLLDKMEGAMENFVKNSEAAEG